MTLSLDTHAADLTGRSTAADDGASLHRALMRLQGKFDALEDAHAHAAAQLHAARSDREGGWRWQTGTANTVAVPR